MMHGHKNREQNRKNYKNKTRTLDNTKGNLLKSLDCSSENITYSYVHVEVFIYLY